MPNLVRILAGSEVLNAFSKNDRFAASGGVDVDVFGTLPPVAVAVPPVAVADFDNIFI